MEITKSLLEELYVDKRISIVKIADQLGVGRKKISDTLSAYRISRPKLTDKVEVKCSNCGQTTLKTLKDLRASEKSGSKNSYCDSTCFGLHHSENMQGEGNPNFGKVGKSPSEYMTAEELRDKALKSWQTSKENGTYAERIEKLQEGSKSFFDTEEGRELRITQGYLSLKSQRRKRTSIEVKMEEELLRRGIDFEQEYSVGSRYLVDFYLPQFNIVVECDGDYWHTIPKVFEKDLRKDAYLISQGYEVVRFYETQINLSVESCVDIILSILNDKEEGDYDS